MNAQVVEANPGDRAADPNQTIGKVLKTTGTVSLSVGVPFLAAGIGCLLYANMVPNPTTDYTTNKATALEKGLKYTTVEEYTRMSNGRDTACRQRWEVGWREIIHQSPV